MAPLGARAWFGNPGLDSSPQPWGHERGVFGRVKAGAPDDCDHRPPDALAPAGNITRIRRLPPR